MGGGRLEVFIKVGYIPTLTLSYSIMNLYTKGMLDLTKQVGLCLQ